MAELFIARQEAVGGFEKNLVLKMLQERYAENPRVVEMFLDEARLAAKLNHQNIVHVYDVDEADGIKYIAMEYIHGETVTDIIRRSIARGTFLPIEHAIHIVAETAAGLAYAHEHRDPEGRPARIVHRDVSPSNILVTYEGQTKIVDFRHRARSGPDPRGVGDAPRQGVVHVARAGAGRGRRPPLGHLFAGDHPLRDHRRAAAVARAARGGDAADRRGADSAADVRPSATIRRPWS